MRGPVDENGMDAAVLEDTIRTAVLDLVDHRDLGRDVPALQGLVSTGENLARAFFDLLGGSAPGAVLARDPGGNREQPVRVWAGRRRSGCTGQGLVPGWMRLTGRVVLVSGGSRGIGRAIAGAPAAEGALLANLARGRAGLEEAAEEIQTGGGRALVIAGDASQEATAAGAVAATMRAFGRLDLLVTAQGTGSFGPLEASRVADWDAMIAANLRATYLLCRAALGPMLKCGVGTIINVASLAAIRAIPGSAAYSASKAGVLGLTRSLAAEVRGRGVRVAALCPGAVDTPFWDTVPRPPDRTRMLRPEAVADAAVLVATQPPEAFVEGVVLAPTPGVL